MLQRAPKFPRRCVEGFAGAGPVWHLLPFVARDRARLAPLSLSFYHHMHVAGVAMALKHGLHTIHII